MLTLISDAWEFKNYENSAQMPLINGLC